jgi:hypothetical protein
LLPATVQSYLADPAFRTGADALLEFGPEKLPPEIAFGDLGTYLAARGAAELTKYDYAETLHRLWCAVWGWQLGEGWTAPSADRLLDKEFSVAPQDCWSDRCLTLYHDRGRYSLFTAVGLDVGKTTLAFSVETDTRVLRAPCVPFTWRDDDEWEGWFVLSHPHDLTDTGFDLEQLVDAARVAVAAAEAFSRPRTSSRRSVSGVD